MIHKELICINGEFYCCTYSDTFTIMRDGDEYTEAIDPLGVERVYTETENKLEAIEEED